MPIDKINPKSEKKNSYGNDDDNEDEKIKKKKSKKSFPGSVFSLKNFSILIGILFLAYFSIRMILKPNLSQYPKLDSCFITTVHKVLLCSQNKNYVRINSISTKFIHSVLISEDDSFYIHQGIDWNEFQKSFIANLKVKKFARGGSTITQQLVKNAYLNQGKSLIRKFKEILIAQQIEKKYPKSVILEKYLNVIELGNNIYGVKSASQHYFGKQPSQLNVLESLYLTTLLPNPKVYSSSFYKKTLPNWQKERIKTLLYRLLKRKRISEELYKSAKARIPQFPWTDIEIIETQTIENDTLDFLQNKTEYFNPTLEPNLEQEPEPETEPQPKFEPEFNSDKDLKNIPEDSEPKPSPEAASDESILEIEDDKSQFIDGSEQ